MLVPFPRAASSRLISFFTFQISICPTSSCQRAQPPKHAVTALTFFSASLAWESLMVNDLTERKTRFGKKSGLA